MAGIKANRPHVLGSERDFERLQRAVHKIEQMRVNDPYQARRYPIGDDTSPGPRRGTLAATLNPCSLTPTLVNELTLDFDSSGNIRGEIYVRQANGLPVQFKVIDRTNTRLSAGTYVSCNYYARDIWEVVAAHCTGKCTNSGTTPPPSSPTSSSQTTSSKQLPPPPEV